MNHSIIISILGYVLKLEGVLMLIPCVTAAIYHEKEGFYYLLAVALCLFVGFLFSIRKPRSTVFYLKEGCVATAASWIIMSIFGCFPLWISGEIPSFTDAMFETISGFTTTGATILNDVEGLSHCALIWRSLTQWIGGMGVLVFLLAVLPLAGGSHINLMRAESPGPSVGKLVPKVRSTARLLYIIYFGMTIAEIIFLLFGKMPLFDAINTSFTTASTGGFGTRADSLTGFSPYIQWVVTIFMIAFGVNFNAYYLLFFGNVKKALKTEEVRYYFIFIFGGVAIIFFNILHLSKNAFDALTQAAFQVASVMTSTGFATADFNLWPQLSKTTILILMFIGACAGSTGGGIKVSRILILVKAVKNELYSYIHPKSIRKINMEAKPLDTEVVHSANIYFITFVLIFVISIFAISFDERDFVTNFSAVTATINNTGPGLAGVGPMENFSSFSDVSKYVLMFDMLAGRLELFPLLILFHPQIWFNVFHRKKKATKPKNSV